MKVCGFSFVRNAITLDYPIVEAIQSVLPLCDEFVIAVGKSEDDTLGLIQRIGDPRIKIVETLWDDTLTTERWRIFAQETDKAFQLIKDDVDWAFYIQADEVLHEQYIPIVKKNMEVYRHDDKVDGLLFSYKHFYASYDYVGDANTWYKQEIRVIKNNKSFFSYHDAQGFRKKTNTKLNVVPIDAYIYHYGWVRHPKAMQQKQNTFISYYEGRNVFSEQDFDYDSCLTALKSFDGTHPQVMHKRIASKNWAFEVDLSIDRSTIKDKVKQFLYRYCGINLYYTNYKVVKTKAYKL